MEGRGEKRGFSTTSGRNESFAKAREALTEMKKKLHAMREEARSRSKARRDSVRTTINPPKSPTDRRLDEPRSYLSCNNSFGCAKDYDDVVEQAANDIRDRGLDENYSGELLDKMPDTPSTIRGTYFYRNLVWEVYRSRHLNQFLIISLVHNAERIGLVSKRAGELRPRMSTMSSHAWERCENGRYFHISKAVAARLRHGTSGGRVDLAMDSAGWVNARYLLEFLHRSPQVRRPSTTMDDLAVIAATGPKGRLQLSGLHP